LLKNSKYILFAFVLLCAACDWALKDNSTIGKTIEVVRYDRLESRYLTTGDFSALQEMNTEYPVETKMLIENVLNLGAVYEPDINSKLLNYYQDTILQKLIADVEEQYSNMDDIKQEMTKAFAKAQKEVKGFTIPTIYTQIGAFDQSIIVGDQLIGISLDKYLGSNYPLYQKYYNANQRSTMSRQYITPDCIFFYLMSLYPMKNIEDSSQYAKDMHTARLMYITNRLVGRKTFNTNGVKAIEKYMKQHDKLTINELLKQ